MFLPAGEEIKMIKITLEVHAEALCAGVTIFEQSNCKPHLRVLSYSLTIESSGEVKPLRCTCNSTRIK